MDVRLNLQSLNVSPLVKCDTSAGSKESISVGHRGDFGRRRSRRRYQQSDARFDSIAVAELRAADQLVPQRLPVATNQPTPQPAHPRRPRQHDAVIRARLLFHCQCHSHSIKKHCTAKSSFVVLLSLFNYIFRFCRRLFRSVVTPNCSAHEKSCN